MTELNPSAIVGVVDSDDPHLAAYLKLRQAVVIGQLQMLDGIAAYAAELRRDLPGSPPPNIAAFIAADIKITFPLLTDQLWTP